MTKKGWIKSKLSLKIVLTHFSIVFFISSLIGTLIKALNVFDYIMANEPKTSMWLILFPLIYGTLIVLLVSYILNTTLIARIKKLKNATTLVAKGNFDNTMEVIGSDELSELTESFNKMTYELRANEYLSKDFIRNISHEYKTPLSVIKAYSELIESEVTKITMDRDLVSEYAQIITDETDRMSTLAQNILQLSLLDSKTIIKKADVFSPAEQIRNMLRTMHVKWGDKNIQFELDLAEGQITSNEQLLYQVWQNLISNAIKFSYDQGLIKLKLRISDNDLSFVITDFGLGIPADEKNIFTHFYMADRARNKEGSGLGLAIAKAIVEKLGGQISYTSSSQEGTQFSVVINIIEE